MTIAGAVVAVLALVVATTLWTRGGKPGTTQGNTAVLAEPSGSEPPIPTPSVASSSPSSSPSASTSAAPSKAAPKAPAPVPGGFPNASTTGVPAGIALRDASTDSHYDANTKLYHGDTAGMTIQNLNVNGQIHVSASNVTIRNVRVNCNNGALAGAIHQGLGAQNLTVDHVTIVGSRSLQCQYGVLASAKGTTIRYSNISVVSDAINPSGNVLVENNYVHDLTFFSGDHVAAFGFDGGNESEGPITIRHNTFDDPNNDGNNLIALYSQNGPIVNTTVDSNWLAGSGHIMWAGGFPSDCSGSPGVHDVRITNNRFSTKYHPDGGSFSAVVGWCHRAPGNLWANNLWADGPRSGTAVTPP